MSLTRKSSLSSGLGMVAHFGKCRRSMRAGLVPVRRKNTALSARWLLEHTCQNQSGLPSLACPTMQSEKWAARFLARSILVVRCAHKGKVFMSAVYFGGSRNLSAHWAGLVGSVVQRVVSSGQGVRVGCQSGADAQVIHSAALLPAPFNSPSSFLVVFAVAPALGIAPRWVRWVVARGVPVRFSAGGSSAPMPARFLLRSIAAFQGCESAVFFQPGPGSLAVARECVRSGLPVFAFAGGESPMSTPPAPVPSVGGQWVASSFMGFQCWQWQAPSQPALF